MHAGNQFERSRVASLDAAWLEEVQRHSREIDQGLVESVPAEEVFARLEVLTTE